MFYATSCTRHISIGYFVAGVPPRRGLAAALVHDPKGIVPK